MLIISLIIVLILLVVFLSIKRSKDLKERYLADYCDYKYCACRSMF